MHAWVLRSASFALALALADATHAITLSVQGGTVEAGAAVEVCFDMSDSGGQVSGIQMDVAWQPGCVTVDSVADEARCVVNPETNRTTFKTKVLVGGGLMRAILLNISDTTPIPANVSVLFCCSFRGGATAIMRSCPITLSNVIASDPKGTRLPVSSLPGAVVVRGTQTGEGPASGPIPAGGPTPVSAVPGAPSARAAPAVSGAENDGGCSVVSPAGSLAWPAWNGLLWVCVWLRKRSVAARC